MGDSLAAKVTSKRRLAAVEPESTDTVAPLKPADCSALCMLAAVPVGLLLSKLICPVLVAVLPDPTARPNRPVKPMLIVKLCVLPWPSLTLTV